MKKVEEIQMKYPELNQHFSLHKFSEVLSESNI
jgi:hypothetical protein